MFLITLKLFYYNFEFRFFTFVQSYIKQHTFRSSILSSHKGINLGMRHMLINLLHYILYWNAQVTIHNES